MSTKSIQSKENSYEAVVAKSDDGSVQITLTIAFELIEKTRNKVAEELGKDIEVPGFRPGFAPLAKVIEQIPSKTLLEKTLSRLLPKLFSDAIQKYHIKPTVYPKFELIKSEEGQDWQIRAQTAQIPDFDLGDYKKEITSQLRAKSIWTPGKGKEKEELSKSQKEQEILKILLEKNNLKIPKMLIDDEVDTRLAKLLERLEKLGLTLESYLASTKKTAESLRTEYEKQAKDSIAIDLILEKIAEKENIKISDEQIDMAIKSYSQDEKVQQELKEPERRKIIESIMRKKTALESLTTIS